MRSKNMNVSTNAKPQNKTNSENDQYRKAFRQIGIRLAAVFLIIVFLASECAALMPVD